MVTTTDTADNAAGSNSPTDRIRDYLGHISAQQRVALAVAVAAIIAILVAVSLWSRQPDLKVLFSGIGERDGGAIIAALDQLNVPYKFSEGGGAILVSAERVHEIRLRLASQGLPKGGSVGFELMDNQKFGISQFAEQVNYQRALEGELSRTIQSIASVQSARVHLAIPKPSVFVREEQKPTASVLLNLYPGRGLEPSQVAGISHLVASSVPQMPMSNINIIDQNGTLLSQLKSKLNDAGLDPTQLKYVSEMEASIIKRIQDILTPVVGSDNLKVQVAADIDFSESEQTAESYKPNTTPPNISIRSQQTSETANVNQAGAQGVPGALSNQPPVPATAPVTNPPVPGQTGTNPQGKPGDPTGQFAAAGITAPLGPLGQPLGSTKNSTINYEVDKTIRHTKQAVGSIKRLTAAVVVNHRKDVGKDGKPTTKPLSDAEMKQINDLVKQAMGFSQDRGDSVSVANSPFTVSDKQEINIPLWKDPETVAFAKDLIKYLIIGGIVAYLLLGVVRPIVKTMFEEAAAAKERALAAEIAKHEAEERARRAALGVEGELTEEEAAEVDQLAMKIQKAKEIAAQDPKIVSNIVKDWMGVNGG